MIVLDVSVPVVFLSQVRSGQIEADGRRGGVSEMDQDVLEEEYLTYRSGSTNSGTEVNCVFCSETLPYIPSIKDLSLSKTSAQVEFQ